MDTVIATSKYIKHMELGKLSARYSADGTRILRYYVDIRHKLLNLHKELSAPEIFLLQHKLDALVAQWDAKTVEHERRSLISSGRDGADQQTLAASARLDGLAVILRHTLKVNDRIDWNSMKDHSKFSGHTDFKQPTPSRIRASEPIFYAPEISFWDKLLGRAKTRLEQAKANHKQALSDWQVSERKAEESLRVKIANWVAQKATFEAEIESKKRNFEEEKLVANSKVDTLAASVATGETHAVVEHATLVLDASDYDNLFEKSFDIEYAPETKTLLLDYQLPSPDEMPMVKAVRFSPTTGELKEAHISEREQKSNYDSVCYQICLRTLHELFEADEFENIDQVLFNGFATYVDRSIGKDVSACIMSILVNRSDFAAIDLGRIDPKLCFKSLKGVSASSLSALAPIPPVMTLNKEDRRFIDPRATAEHIDDATNLASMDWEDFEHLVREVFEREFALRGGEVKITQSSSDGGVDAVAFDPDPITGGKIVIQAKRYTRTVGVSAIRDLYGTMQHESASRGILVTTADYGPDAHKFASGKPITLMTGANLLYLLGKHGIKAKINLQEARKEMNLRDYN